MQQERVTLGSDAANSPFAEAFGLLSASLLLRNGTSTVHTICLTAGRQGDGTSTTAVYLARSIAELGRRTLIVDANFHTPVLHRVFDLSASPGLADVIANSVPLKAAVRPTSYPHLFLLAAGMASGQPHAWLQPDALSHVFDEIRQNFEFIIIDSAPALRSRDALLIARVSDGMLVVMPQGTPRRAAIEVRKLLERVEIKVLGVVMNRSGA